MTGSAVRKTSTFAARATPGGSALTISTASSARFNSVPGLPLLSESITNLLKAYQITAPQIQLGINRRKSLKSSRSASWTYNGFSLAKFDTSKHTGSAADHTS